MKFMKAAALLLAAMYLPVFPQAGAQECEWGEVVRAAGLKVE